MCIFLVSIYLKCIGCYVYLIFDLKLIKCAAVSVNVVQNGYQECNCMRILY